MEQETDESIASYYMGHEVEDDVVIDLNRPAPIVVHGSDMKRLCIMCKASKHGECELHINDGAVDAEDFVHTWCECVCEGGVPEGGKLIQLVGVLRQTIESRDEALVKAHKQLAEAQAAPAGTLRALKEFFDAFIDDEGQLLGLSSNRNWKQGVLRLYQVYLGRSYDPDEDGPIVPRKTPF